VLIDFHKHNNTSASTSVDRRITYGINAVIDGMQAEFAADMRPFTMDNRTFLSLRAMPISIFIEDVRQLTYRNRISIFPTIKYSLCFPRISRIT